MLSAIKFPWKFSLNLSKFCQARGNAFLFRFLPFRLSRGYLSLVGKIYYWFKRREKNLIRATIRYLFGNDLELCALKALTQDAFQGIIDHYHEKLFLAYANFPKLKKFLMSRVKLQGAEELQEILAGGQGVILVTGHYGAVEFLPGTLSLRGYPVSMICRFQTNRLRESLKQRAEAVGLHLIDSDDGKVFLAAIKALKSGRILITECDEFDAWRTGEGQDINFMNCRLPGDRTLEILQKRSGAPVVTALMQRHGEENYSLNLTPVLSGRPGEGNAVGKACLQVLEAAIRKTPAQWYQWKKFGQMLDLNPEAVHDYQEGGHLAPELEVPVPV